jgi:hypothetical protein
MLARRVGSSVVRMPQVQNRTRQGFSVYILAPARQTGVSANSGAGINA